jgi:TerC family integral membrane protein
MTAAVSASQLATATHPLLDRRCLTSRNDDRTRMMDRSVPQTTSTIMIRNGVVRNHQFVLRLSPPQSPQPQQRLVPENHHRSQSQPNRRQSTRKQYLLGSACYYGIIVFLWLAFISSSNGNSARPRPSSSLWYVNAFSISTTNDRNLVNYPHGHHHYCRSSSSISSRTSILQHRRNIQMGITTNNDAKHSRITTTTTLHMTSKSNHFETDSPNSNEDLPLSPPSVIMPVNNDSTAMTSMSGSTSTAAALTTATTSSNASPTTITSGATTSTPLKSSNNPPFLVTLDDATKYSYTEAIQRTIGWVSAAILFGTAVWITNGATTGEEFFAGYIVEQSLSVDNLFVFLLLFEYFQVPIQYQDRVLNWGIYGAIVMRSVMIGLGSVALQQFHFILLVFAAILVYSSVSFFLQPNNDEEKEDPSQNSIVQFSRSLFPSTDTFDEDRFFTMVNGIRTATPLFICMIAVEISDVVFAIDSIPAVFGVTEVCMLPSIVLCNFALRYNSTRQTYSHPSLRSCTPLPLSLGRIH